MLPKYNQIQEPLLAEIKRRGGSAKPSEKDMNGLDIYDVLADYFGLTTQDLAKKVYEKDSKARSKWKNMVRWARNDLCKQGLLDCSQRGVWTLSDEGNQRVDFSQNEFAGRGVFLLGATISPDLLKKNQDRAKEIGDKGEFFVLQREKAILQQAGRDNLAAAVEHVAQKNVAAGYDIKSFGLDGRVKFIEVKSSTKQSGSFEITSNELAVAKQKQMDYWIYKVSEVETETPSLEMIQNPVAEIEDEKLMLIPTSYRVIISDS